MPRTRCGGEDRENHARHDADTIGMPHLPRRGTVIKQMPRMRRYRSGERRKVGGNQDSSWRSRRRGGEYVPARGNAGPHNGITGNIQVYIEEETNNTFVRDGQNIIYNLLLDFPTAALGGDVEIPTIEGTKVKVKIETGTQPGKRHCA